MRRNLVSLLSRFSPRSYGQIWPLANSAVLALSVVLVSLAIPKSRPIQALTGLLMYIPISIVQDFLISRKLRKPAGLWFITTLFSGAIPFYLWAYKGHLIWDLQYLRSGLLIANFVISFTGGSFLGFCTGIAQIAIFRNTQVSNFQWLIRSTLGMGVGYALSAFILKLAEVYFLMTPWDKDAVGIAVYALIGSLIGLSYGLVTSPALTRNR